MQKSGDSKYNSAERNTSASPITRAATNLDRIMQLSCMSHQNTRRRIQGSYGEPGATAYPCGTTDRTHIWGLRSYQLSAYLDELFPQQAHVLECCIRNVPGKDRTE